MIYEILQYTGTGLTSVPVSYVVFRVVQFRNAIRRGKDMHEFKAHRRRDMYGLHVMSYCDVCNQGPNAWIHSQSKSIVPAKSTESQDSRLRNLERDDIKWRFENDPEWVKVFGEEYDPRTFYPIPQFHNGECGGALDSCPRCNWEADQREAEAKQKRRDREKEMYVSNRKALAKKETEKESNSGAVKAEIGMYESILRDIWLTVDDFDTADEEFEDVENELGMHRNPTVRDTVKNLNAFKRLTFCLRCTERKTNMTRWKRREEVWDTEKKRRQDNERYGPTNYHY